MDGHLGQIKELLEIIYLTIDYRPEELGKYMLKIRLSIQRTLYLKIITFEC